MKCVRNLLSIYQTLSSENVYYQIICVCMCVCVCVYKFPDNAIDIMMIISCISLTLLQISICMSSRLLQQFTSFAASTVIGACASNSSLSPRDNRC